MLAPYLSTIQGEDALCTLTHLTAWSVADSYQRFIIHPQETLYHIEEVILCGGGAYNPTLRKYLVQYLEQLLGSTPRLSTMSDYGVNNSAKEALAFAVLAWAKLHGLPNNIPSCTGASRWVSLGHIALP
jgi:anhydro-N-acetylmuramic acid kinase